MRLITILCLVLLSSCSQEPEVVQEPEVFTGPFLTRDGVIYHQDTNEPVTGVVQVFHNNGQLVFRDNYVDGKRDGLNEFFHDNGQLRRRYIYIDGEQDGLQEYFDRNGNLFLTQTYRNGVQVEEDRNPLISDEIERILNLTE